LIDIIKRGLEGIKVADITLAIDEIRNIGGKGKNYLGTKHSVKNTRKEMNVPELTN